MGANLKCQEVCLGVANLLIFLKVFSVIKLRKKKKLQGYSVKVKKLNKNQGFSATNFKSHLEIYSEEKPKKKNKLQDFSAPNLKSHPEIYSVKSQKKKKKRLNSCSAILNPKSPRELYSEEKSKKKNKPQEFSAPNLKSSLQVCSVVRLKNPLEVYLVVVLNLNNL